MEKDVPGASVEIQKNSWAAQRLVPAHSPPLNVPGANQGVPSLAACPLYGSLEVCAFSSHLMESRG